ncbi:MAG: glucosaminidase domain-containing protein [Cytophagales bacterium]|nr:glucosaminidase domain-containing protein [Cytophagales bacterium]
MDKTILIIDHVTVEKKEDIKSIKDSLVIPVLYKDVHILNKLNIAERKKKFIDVILPAILIHRHQLAQKIEHTKLLQEKSRYSLKWTREDSVFIKSSYETYKTKNMHELIRRMQPPPVSLVIAQAALESGWGSSRFFKEANNVFGIWSFSENDQRIVANESRGGKPIYLKKYDNFLGSVEDYHILLAKSNAYSDFRDCIHRSNNVFELIWYLRLYSERRDQYVIMLRNVIVANNLIDYDSYKLDPEFFDYPADENSIF